MFSDGHLCRHSSGLGLLCAFTSVPLLLQPHVREVSFDLRTSLVGLGASTAEKGMQQDLELAFIVPNLMSFPF